MFNSHIPCRAQAMPWPCRSESNFSRPQYSAASAWLGMYELALAVQRWHVGNLPVFGFFWLPCGVPQRLLSEAYQPIKLQYKQFRYFWLPSRLSQRTRHCRIMAGARHSMCELACKVLHFYWNIKIMSDHVQMKGFTATEPSRPVISNLGYVYPRGTNQDI
jgi:hypothetical protein